MNGCLALKIMMGVRRQGKTFSLSYFTRDQSQLPVPRSPQPLPFLSPSKASFVYFRISSAMRQLTKRYSEATSEDARRSYQRDILNFQLKWSSDRSP